MDSERGTICAWPHGHTQRLTLASTQRGFSVAVSRARRESLSSCRSCMWSEVSVSCARAFDLSLLPIRIPWTTIERKTLGLMSCFCLKSSRGSAADATAAPSARNRV